MRINYEARQELTRLFHIAKGNIMKRFNLRNFMVALVSLCAVSVSACNTIEGVGKDIESAGGAVEDAAK